MSENNNSIFVQDKFIPEAVQEALALILAHARGDTGGSRRCAGFLLSLWDGDQYKVDLQSLLYIDSEIFSAFQTIMSYLYNSNNQLSSVLNRAAIKLVSNYWGDSFSR